MTIPVKTPQADVMEAVLLKGDLAKLTPAERTAYYMKTCESMGLNPLTQPFEYVTLNGRMRLYALRTATDQLRKLNGVSIEIVSRAVEEDILTVHVRARMPDGRVDEDLGAVAYPAGLKGEARANAELKAVTKAKRRVTLSICGLGWLCEDEIHDIRLASRDDVPGAGVRKRNDARVAAAEDPHAETEKIIEEWGERQGQGLIDGMKTPAEKPTDDPPHDPETGELVEPSAALKYMLDTREHIRTATDAAALHAWWSDDAQKKARKDMLTVGQRNQLMQDCTDKIQLLKRAPSVELKPSIAGPKPMTLAQHAGMLCGTGSFQTWLGVKTTDEAADILRSRCGVASRAEIRSGSIAANVFVGLVADYEGWLAAEKAGVSHDKSE